MFLKYKITKDLPELWCGVQFGVTWRSARFLQMPCVRETASRKQGPQI